MVPHITCEHPPDYLTVLRALLNDPGKAARLHITTLSPFPILVSAKSSNLWLLVSSCSSHCGVVRAYSAGVIGMSPRASPHPSAPDLHSGNKNRRGRWYVCIGGKEGRMTRGACIQTRAISACGGFLSRVSSEQKIWSAKPWLSGPAASIGIRAPKGDGCAGFSCRATTRTYARPPKNPQQPFVAALQSPRRPHSNPCRAGEMPKNREGNRRIIGLHFNQESTSCNIVDRLSAAAAVQHLGQ